MNGDASLEHLRWLIAAGVQVTIGVVQRGDCSELRVAVDLDDDPQWFGNLEDCLADAKTYCLAQEIEP